MSEQATSDRVFSPALMDEQVPRCPHCVLATIREWWGGGICGGDPPATYRTDGLLLTGRRGRRWDRWRYLHCGGEYVTQEGGDGIVVCEPIRG